MWNFGSLLGATLVLQILTGVFLAMHYIPHTSLAFSSVEHVDINLPIRGDTHENREKLKANETKQQTPMACKPPFTLNKKQGPYKTSRSL